MATDQKELVDELREGFERAADAATEAGEHKPTASRGQSAAKPRSLNSEEEKLAEKIRKDFEALLPTPTCAEYV